MVRPGYGGCNECQYIFFFNDILNTLIDCKRFCEYKKLEDTSKNIGLFIDVLTVKKRKF